MLVYRRIVFDDVLTGIGQVDYTSSVYDALLGTTDELAVEVVVDQVGASTLTLTVTAEHSGDARNWSPLGSDVVSATLSDPLNVYVAPVTGGPALGCVRFKLVLGGSGSPPWAHVKIVVTARDKVARAAQPEVPQAPEVRADAVAWYDEDPPDIDDDPGWLEGEVPSTQVLESVYLDPDILVLPRRRAQVSTAAWDVGWLPEVVVGAAARPRSVT